MATHLTTQARGRLLVRCTRRLLTRTMVLTTSTQDIPVTATRWATHRTLRRTVLILTTGLPTWAVISLLLRLTTATDHRHPQLCKHQATHQATHLTRATHTHLHPSALHPTIPLWLRHPQPQLHLCPKLTRARSRHRSPSQSPTFQSQRRTNARTPSKARVNSNLPPSQRPKRKHSLARNRKRQLRPQLLPPPLPRRPPARPSQASTRCSQLAKTANRLFARAAEAQAVAAWHPTSRCTSLASRRVATSRRCETWTRRLSRLTRRRESCICVFFFLRKLLL